MIETPAFSRAAVSERETVFRARYRRLVERLGHARWFAAGLRSVGAAVDARLYRMSRGRISIAGPVLFPVLLLTTTGRRSGRTRTTPVIYVRDGESLIVSSESFGQERLAAWPLNLEADPRVRVQIGARIAAYVGRRASPEEVERYWPALLEAWPAHDTYHQRSGVRKVYVLMPAGPDPEQSPDRESSISHGSGAGHSTQ